MVTVELPSGKLYVTDRFTYTRQVGDIGDIATSNANFTNSFNTRRDKTSIRTLKGLGVPSSDSKIPYQKVPSKVKVNGMDVINDGWFQVSETNKSNFKISVLDGNIDFWKAIEGVTLQDIDLSESIHEKNLTTVIASFTNDYYKYILADYGGQTDTVNLRYNIAHLPPAINEYYIFRRIFSYINMSYVMPIDIDTWLTYPKESSADLGMDDPSILTVLDGTYTDNNGFNFSFQGIQYDLDPANNGSTFNINNGATGFEDGNYDIDFSFTEASAEYTLEQITYGDIIYVRAPVKILINISGQEYNGDITAIRLNPTDTVSVIFRGFGDGADFGYSGYLVNDINDLEINNFKVNIAKYLFEQINFGNALKNIKATDFIKYIMHRYGLTLFYKEKTVTFKTVEERLTAPIVDYSDLYKERTSERYVYSNYAQRNILAHKYVDDDTGFNDGVIYNNNKNLREEITLLESFTYSPTRTNQLITFEKEVKEKTNGELEINYKWIDRNFSIKASMRLTLGTTLYSEIEENEILFTGTAPELNVRGITFNEYVNTYYPRIQEILNNSKIHTIDFKMSIYQFLNVDLSKRIYLRQEAAEYLINSIKLVKENEVQMELIKLNK